mmetsp:Transcript_37053/g.90054  ORF Transcript_37053/g.90054 Transcript_37053/m.90054 type:complete len:354 (-) Transcript_37053:36-1097(-)
MKRSAKEPPKSVAGGKPNAGSVHAKAQLMEDTRKETNETAEKPASLEESTVVTTHGVEPNELKNALVFLRREDNEKKGKLKLSWKYDAKRETKEPIGTMGSSTAACLESNTNPGSRPWEPSGSLVLSRQQWQEMSNRLKVAEEDAELLKSIRTQDQEQSETFQKKVNELEQKLHTSFARFEKRLASLQSELQATTTALRETTTERDELKQEVTAMKQCVEALKKGFDLQSIKKADDMEDTVAALLVPEPKSSYTCIVIDNLPKVPRTKLEKLTKLVIKLASTDVFGGVHMLFDEARDTTLGYCYVVYEAPEDANNAFRVLDGYKFDKNHTLSVSVLPYSYLVLTTSSLLEQRR